METCIYEIDYQYHSRTSFAFDEMHAHALVEAPKDIWRNQLENLCNKKFNGFWRLNSFRKVYITKLI